MFISKQIPVITGIGMITGLGVGHEKNWDLLLKGTSCIRHLDHLDKKGLPGRIGGMLPDDFPDACKAKLSRITLRRTANFVKMGVLSAKLALEDAGLNVQSLDPARIGVVIGNCVGGLSYLEELVNRKNEGEDITDILVYESTAASKFMQNALSAHVALDGGFRGPNFVVSAACSSGNYALALAADMIREGKCDVVIAGGVEAFISNFSLSSFFNLGALTSFEGDPRQAVKPFDENRNGTAISDGAALFVVESMEVARKRKANPYCRIAGVGMTCEAYDIVLPDPNGDRMADVMRMAIRDAGMQPDEVTQIQAHGTATVSNDKAETNAIKQVFGSHAYAMPVVSIKGMVGHAIGAAGSLSVATGCLSYRKHAIPGTVNLEHPDPECDLDYVMEGPRSIESAYCLCNAFALGGHAACIVLGRV